jgi:hypothetical protein
MKLKVAHLPVGVFKFPPGMADAEDARGMCDMSVKQIFIDTRLPPVEQAEVLIHEMLHAFWFAVAWGDGKVPEEVCVTRASRGLTTLLVDNEGLFKVLHEAVHKGKPLPL